MKNTIPQQPQNPVGQEVTAAQFRETLLHHLTFSCATAPKNISLDALSHAVSLSVREQLINTLIQTEERYSTEQSKRFNYLSMEFLLGRALGNTLINIGLFELVKDTLSDMGISLADLLEHETDASLGHGGLGRLAACFLDSLATLNLPGFGYGLNYEFGLFRQDIVNGYQLEKPHRLDTLLNPWLIARPAIRYRVPLYGRIEHRQNDSNHYRPTWVEKRYIIGIAHDLPVVGYGGESVNYLRLFTARASDEFDFPIHLDSDYYKASRQKISSESVSKLLYSPEEESPGLEYRLLQEYFLVSCAIQDIIRIFLSNGNSFLTFSEKTAIQLNDTNPALAIVELMRCLIDEHDLDWDSSWDITTASCSYTNHTLVPETLKKWPVSLFEKLLPRHLQIIYEINHRFLDHVRLRFPDDENAPTRMSLFEEVGGKEINMSHLAIVGSHAVNGVADLHSNLLRTTLFPDFALMWPKKFQSITNGVTQRRWLLTANPHLSALITEAIGNDWITNLDVVKRLEDFAADSGFQDDFQTTRLANKQRLADRIFKSCNVLIDPTSLFDVQIKRIHEYKRQLLHILHIIHIYQTIIEDDELPLVPRTHIFAGKAEPGYSNARLIVKLINNVAKVINSDPRVRDAIKVVMLPDFNVSLAEKIIPAADLSEQISTAGTEASGTSNMKLALNGALTIGTRDGATIEIMEEVGIDNIFMFGLQADEIEEMRTESSYNPWDYYANNPSIRRVMDCLESNMFCQEEPALFSDLYNSIMHEGDYYFHLADLQPYIDTQQQVTDLFTMPSDWTEKAILNMARVGKFSSDRTIREYVDKIWCPVSGK